MQLSPPLLEMRVSLERLSKLLTRREASFNLEQSNETCGCRAKAVDSKVDPSSSFVLDPLDDAKLLRAYRFKHSFIDDEYLLYKGRVCILIVGDFRLQILKESHDSSSVGHLGIQKVYALVKRQFYWQSLFKASKTMCCKSVRLINMSDSKLEDYCIHWIFPKGNARVYP